MKRTAAALRHKASDLGLPLGHRRWLRANRRKGARSGDSTDAARTRRRGDRM